MKKIKLLTSLIALPILCTNLLPLVSCGSKPTTQTFTVTTNGSSSGVTFDGLPSEWTKGGSDINGTYSFNSTTMKLNEEYSDILIGNNSIKSKSGVVYKSGYITVPASLITDNVTIKIVIQEKTSYTVSTTGSSSGITFSGLPEKWYEKGGDISATYVMKDPVINQIDEDNSDILVGTTSIKTAETVEWKEGVITIPANLINGNITIKLVTKYKDGYISTSWDTIINACNVFEESDRGTTAQTTFLSAFTVTGKTSLSSLNDLVGAWTCITINNQKHIVRIIDTQHDTIATGQVHAGTKTALTFELVTLLSNSDGSNMTSVWDLENNNDYTNSVLRWNLNGAGSGTQPWKGVWTNSALSLLPSEVSNGIKTVNKKIATTSSYTVNSYEDKLFPLTWREMAQPTSQRVQDEGEPYTYWTQHNTKDARIKKNANNEAYYYWLSSPYIANNKYALPVGYDGSLDGIMDVYSSNGVSFAFCI